MELAQEVEHSMNINLIHVIKRKKLNWLGEVGVSPIGCSEGTRT